MKDFYQNNYQKVTDIQRAEMVEQVVSGLAYAHKNGWGKMQLSQIFVAKNCRFPESSLQILIGGLHYSFDPKDDMYSMGEVIYFLLTGSSILGQQIGNYQFEDN